MSSKNIACQQHDLPNGFRIETFPDSDYMVDEIWKENFYEKDFKILPNMTVVDIGANQGVFALLVASKGANVYSYEPDVDNFQIMTENIKRNNQEHLISCFNEAVGGNNSSVDMYIPSVESGGGASSVFITTNKSMLNNHCFGFQGFNTRKVKQITFGSVLSRLPKDTIVDLLKVDCEGAEIDIFNSACVEEMERVSNIVMETHEAYDEGQLFNRIKHLGFRVVVHKKIHGFHRIGYIFATRENRKEVKIPAAKLFAPEYAVVGEKVLFDASGSFSTDSEKNKLQYDWVINGEVVSSGGESKIEYCAEDKGAIELKIIVKDGDFSDFDTKSISCIHADYVNGKADFYLNEPQSYVHLNEVPKGTSTIAISNKYIPKHWDVKRIGALIFISGIDGPAEMGFFESNEKILKNGSNTQALKYIRNNLDFKFEIYLHSNCNLVMMWWPESESAVF